MVNRSALLAQLGRRDEAREVLTQVVASGGEWGDPAQITADRLDIRLKGESPEGVR